MPAPESSGSFRDLLRSLDGQIVTAILPGMAGRVKGKLAWQGLDTVTITTDDGAAYTLVYAGLIMVSA